MRRTLQRAPPFWRRWLERCSALGLFGWHTARMAASKLLQMSNLQIENRAIEYVLAHERAAHREAEDLRKEPDSPVDVKSFDPETQRTRLIEVKAFGGAGRGEFLWLEKAQADALLGNPDGHVYLVTHVRSEDPSDIRLLDLSGLDLQERLQAGKPKSYVEVPMPVAMYDRLCDSAVAPVEPKS